MQAPTKVSGVLLTGMVVLGWPMPATLSAAGMANNRSGQTLDTSHVPGTVIAHYPKSERKYVGSPGIAIVGDHVYLAKHDEFGPGSSEHSSAITQLYRSEDAGKTWRHTYTFDALFWASIFTLEDAVYLLGTDKHHGNVVISRSRDGGQTWTQPADAEHGLLRTGENHTAPVPVVIHNGRVWRAIEDAGGGTVWGQRYRAMMMSAPADADLLKAATWTFTNYIARDSRWLNGKFNAWLEGNAVIAPDNKIVNFLRVDYNPEGEVAAIVRVSDDGRTAKFDPDNDIVKLPGGATKFTIRRDPRTNLYWTLSNYTPEFHCDTPAASARNTLAIASSPDLRCWTVRSVVLYHPDPKDHAFQYVDWLFEGNDLIAVSRTAYDDGLGGAHRFHDANFLTFHRIRDFRSLKMADSTPEFLNRPRGVPRCAKERNEVKNMNTDLTAVRPGLVTKALAVCSIATFWMIPVSPFVTMVALVRTKHTVGWPRRLSVAAAVLCSAFTVAYASMLFFVTIYILRGGLNQ